MDTWVASRRTARLVLLSVAGPWVRGSAFCFIYAVHPGLGFVYTLERRESSVAFATDCVYVELLDHAGNFPDRVVNSDNGQDRSLIAQGLWAQALVATWRTARFVHRDFAVRAYDVLCLAGHIPT